MKKIIHLNKLAYLSLSLLVSLAFFSPSIEAKNTDDVACHSRCMNMCRNSPEQCHEKRGISNPRVTTEKSNKYCKRKCKEKENNSTLM